jgi:hypothetical protein
MKKLILIASGGGMNSKLQFSEGKKKGNNGFVNLWSQATKRKTPRHEC